MLRRVDLTTMAVTTIPHRFGHIAGLANDSEGMLYVLAEDGLHEMRGIDGVVSLLAPVAAEFDTALEFSGLRIASRRDEPRPLRRHRAGDFLSPGAHGARAAR